MRDLAMAAKPFAQCISQRDDRKRQRANRQNGMRGEQNKIYRTNPALASEANDSCVKVKIKVEAEKYDGTKKSAYHTSAVPANFSIANEGQAANQKHGADPVKSRVNGGKGREWNDCHR